MFTLISQKVNIEPFHYYTIVRYRNKMEMGILWQRTTSPIRFFFVESTYFTQVYVHVYIIMILLKSPLNNVRSYSRCDKEEE